MVVDVVSDASTETVLFADVPVKVQMKITYTCLLYTSDGSQEFVH